MGIKDLTEKYRALIGDSIADARARKLEAALAERDAEIARLEQTIAEQEQQAAEIQQALEQTEFKYKTLEHSYATQLEKARERADAAERLADERLALIDELAASQKTLTRDLNDARSRLDALGPRQESIDDILAEASVENQEPYRSKFEDTHDAPDSLQPDEMMLEPDVMLASGQK